MLYPAHLNGRERRLVDQGLCDSRDAVWLALACLHGGVFTHRQLGAWMEIAAGKPVSRMAPARTVERLAERGLVVPEDIGSAHLGAVLRVSSGRAHRAVGATGRPLRKGASRSRILRRLLSLDFVLSCPGYPWKPTEREQMDSLIREVAVPREMLPRRKGCVYPLERDRRFFTTRLTVGLETDRSCARFVCADGEGADPCRALKAWGRTHAPLWNWLRANWGNVEAVFVTRNRETARRAQRILWKWSLDDADRTAARIHAEQVLDGLLLLGHDITGLGQDGFDRNHQGSLIDMRERLLAETGPVIAEESRRAADALFVRMRELELEGADRNHLDCLAAQRDDLLAAAARSHDRPSPTRIAVTHAHVWRSDRLAGRGGSPPHRKLGYAELLSRHVTEDSWFEGCEPDEGWDEGWNGGDPSIPPPSQF